MEALTLDRVSDAALDEEYRKRFFLKAGARLSSAEDAAKHFNVLFSKDPSREHFGVIYLNGANRVITSEILFVGSLTASQVHPREIIKRALEKNAAAIVCSHNHPSGNTRPSQDDLQITKKIRLACETVEIALHDHVIVTSEGYYSFADHGIN
ncbi:MAG: DNA repair protein RadC [Candidatus Marinimicrobia bacterium]|nr:DNA repair protein RadC [Candidatus Neomarinimicrobiota bacterium]